MILGLSDTEKKFKTAMDTAGADMTVVNSWLKLYVKSTKFYFSFILDMDRSPSFGSILTDLTPYSDLLSLRLQTLSP